MSQDRTVKSSPVARVAGESRSGAHLLVQHRLEVAHERLLLRSAREIVRRAELDLPSWAEGPALVEGV